MSAELRTRKPTVLTGVPILVALDDLEPGSNPEAQTAREEYQHGRADGRRGERRGDSPSYEWGYCEGDQERHAR